MTGWTTDKKSPPPIPPVTAAVDPAAVTSFCTAFCILFNGVRLHEIGCDIGNGRDPILVDRMVIRDALRGTPYEEVDY